MQELLFPIYPWLKAGHIIFVIFWMAGLFMLPRMFVYHQEDGLADELHERWVSRERKMLKIILAPAIVVVWVLGISLAYAIEAWEGGVWLHVKFLIVLILSGYHGYLASYAKALARGEAKLAGKKLRLLNEVPGVAAALIVILVVIKPF